MAHPVPGLFLITWFAAGRRRLSLRTRARRASLEYLPELRLCHFRGIALALLLFILAYIGSPKAVASDTDDWAALHLLGREIATGSKSKFAFIPDTTYEASYLNMPVFVARGSSPGPALCLTAGIHGDELNGVEVVRRAFAQIDAEKLHGTVIALPAINAVGVRSGSRYLSDRRDLNRAFPGRAGGSVAALIAHAVFENVLQHCDALVDLHTASNNRANLPQVRADISDPEIRELAMHFGLGIVVGGAGPDGSLRREAARIGIPSIIYEAGEPYRFQEEEISRGVQGVENIMAHLEMTARKEQEIPDARVYEKSRWVRTAAGEGGFFFPSADLGRLVTKGETLGIVVDPLTDERHEVIAPFSGEVVGMAVSQPVLSGYALYHLAWHSEQ
jgi:predicted deacylase